MNGTWILLVVIAAIAVTGLAARKNLQAPLVLVAIGAAASFIPGLPRLELPPDVLLGAVLPPLLYSAALRFSVPTFRRYLSPILRLGIVTVLATAFAVAFFANWLVPELTFGAALVLGAVVAPTDAVSAVAVSALAHPVSHSCLRRSPAARTTPVVPGPGPRRPPGRSPVSARGAAAQRGRTR